MFGEHAHPAVARPTRKLGEARSFFGLPLDFRNAVLHGLAELGFLDGIRPRGPKDGENLGRLLRIAALGVVGDLADKSHGEEVGQRRARKRGGPADAAALGGLKLGPGLDLGAIGFGKKLGAGEGDVFVAGASSGGRAEKTVAW